MEEDPTSYWNEPLRKGNKKEPHKAFLIFQEYLHMEYLKKKGGRSQKALIKHLRESSNNALKEVKQRQIVTYSKRYEWVKRAKAYDEYRMSVISDLNKQILSETLYTNCMTELHNSEVMKSLSGVASRLYDDISKILINKLKDENVKMDLEELRGHINLLKDIQEFFLENSEGICTIKKTNIRAGLEKAVTDELVEGSYTELLRNPDERNRILNECNDYDEIYKQELERNKVK